MKVMPKICESVARRAVKAGSQIEWHIYPGAGHDYDDPGQKKQSVEANHAATEDTFRRAEAFFARYLAAN